MVGFNNSYNVSGFSFDGELIGHRQIGLRLLGPTRLAGCKAAVMWMKKPFCRGSTEHNRAHKLCAVYEASIDVQH
jgi:hypothetical protein